jgi:hypothetical protein
MDFIDKLRGKIPYGTMKGQLGGLPAAFVGIVVALLIAAFGALILSSVGATMTANSAEANITDTGITAISDMADLVAPLGVVLVAAVIIGVLMYSFGGAGRR